MALYLGSGNKKIRLGSTIMYINLYASIAIINGIALVSSDNYMLKDSRGLYLTAKEER